MKIAKPSEQDIECGGKLLQILNAIDGRFGGPLPAEGPDDLLNLLEDEDWDYDSVEHLQALYNRAEPSCFELRHHSTTELSLECATSSCTTKTKSLIRILTLWTCIHVSNNWLRRNRYRNRSRLNE